MTAEMLIESQCLHHNKQRIEAAEESSGLMYGWLPLQGLSLATFHKSCRPVRVTDNYPKDHTLKHF